MHSPEPRRSWLTICPVVKFASKNLSQATKIHLKKEQNVFHLFKLFRAIVVCLLMSDSLQVMNYINYVKISHLSFPETPAMP